MFESIFVYTQNHVLFLKIHSANPVKYANAYKAPERIKLFFDLDEDKVRRRRRRESALYTAASTYDALSRTPAPCRRLVPIFSYKTTVGAASE